jgi:hypothetical protein
MSDDNTKYPPFITSRSPSFLRADEAFDRDPKREAEHKQAALDILGQLSEAERDASEVCASMSALLADEDLAEVVRDRVDLHDARRRGISTLIASMGATPPTASARTILTRTRDAVAQASSDALARRSLALMHKELGATYKAALDSNMLDEEARSLLTSFAPSKSPR